MIDYQKIKMVIDRYAKDYMLLERVYQKVEHNADLEKVLDLAQDKIEDNLKIAWEKFLAEISEDKTKVLVDILDWIQKHPELVEYRDGKIYYKADNSVMMEEM